VDEGVSEFGQLDIVSANAGNLSYAVGEMDHPTPAAPDALVQRREH
jgi:hypothetical protein